MADYARLLSSTWKTDFVELTRDEQWLYWLLVSQPEISNCGVLAVTPARWSLLAADTDADSVRRFLAGLAAKDKLLIDDRTEELWVRKYVEIDGLAKMNPNGLKSVRKAADGVLSPALRERSHEEIDRVSGTVRQGVCPPRGLNRGLHPAAAAEPGTPEQRAAAAAQAHVDWKHSTGQSHNPKGLLTRVLDDDGAELVAYAREHPDAATSEIANAVLGTPMPPPPSKTTVTTTEVVACDPCAGTGELTDRKTKQRKPCPWCAATGHRTEIHTHEQAAEGG